MTRNSNALGGSRVAIDPWARLLQPERIQIGNDVRIDAGAILSATFPIVIGNHVHIAAGVKIFASGGSVRVEDFANLSVDVKIFTASDDYTGGSLTNPTVPGEFRNLTTGDVLIGSHAIVGSGSVILPGVTLGFGAAIGALSLVRRDVPEGCVAAGIPAQEVGTRDTANIRRLEIELHSKESG